MGDLLWFDENYFSDRVDRVGVGDDWGDWINLSHPSYFRFYGGRGSGEY